MRLAIAIVHVVISSCMRRPSYLSLSSASEASSDQISAPASGFTRVVRTRILGDWSSRLTGRTRIEGNPRGPAAHSELERPQDDFRDAERHRHEPELHPSNTILRETRVREDEHPETESREGQTDAHQRHSLEHQKKSHQDARTRSDVTTVGELSPFNSTAWRQRHRARFAPRSPGSI